MFAPAYSGLADAYGLLFVFTPVAPREMSARAKSAALKALEIDSTLAQAHTSLAHAIWVHDFDGEGAEREYRRALELDAGYAPAHIWYAMYLMNQGRFDEALAQALRAEELDLLSFSASITVGRAFYFKRE